MTPGKLVCFATGVLLCVSCGGVPAPNTHACPGGVVRETSESVTVVHQEVSTAMVQSMLELPTADSVLGVVAGQLELCALTSGREIYCWGEAEPNLDVRRVCEWHSRSPVRVFERANALFACDDLFCAMDAAGHRRCWGRAGRNAMDRDDDGYVCAPTVVD